MTTELTKAAQQALEVLESLQGGCTDHDDGTVEAITVWCPEVIEALRNALTQRPAALRPGASNEATTQTQDDSSSDVQVDQGRVRHADSRVGSTVPDLTQRPAAQTDEQTIVEICERIGFGRVQQIAGHAWEQKHHCAPRGRMGVTVRNETPAPQQATPEPLTPDQQSALKQALFKSARIVEQATPEPVGEVVYQLQSGDGKWIDQTRASYDYNVKHGNTVRVLYTRPAPGVPEGFAMVPMTEDELNEMALQLGREMKGLRCWGWMDLVRAVERHHSKKLAAAQAKGEQ